MKLLSRRTFVQGAALSLGAAALAPRLGFGAQRQDTAVLPQKTPVTGSKKITPGQASGSVAKVYFSPFIDEASLIKLYNLVNEGIYGKVAIKVHTGEPNGPNILPRELVAALQKTIPDSAIVETNTLYEGGRYTTEGHRKTLEVNGWTFCPVDILDENGDVSLPVRDGFHLKEVAMGKGITDYDSMLVLTHFKGHSSGGFGGSMKNIAIGCASGQVGKRQVHGTNMEGKPEFGTSAKKELFMELMADSAKAVIDHFGKHITYINILRNISVDCDCAGTRAHTPTMKDIGILASNDLLAIDQAACDLVFAAPDSKDVIERIESRHGLRQLSAMREKKMGNPQYELVVVN
ncbi:DUF362 domain-containing protein [Desulfovibrio sp.]|uniref:DUF362 domain-containing protein n=1 Tax=Desulfovibrio sp. TaxID=885 RepID=UPI0023D3DE87|nr:DUF362 domain-containing protein [Desulfovibrio sp.]MDE7241066.1 DUF362 domain-containing protein [Desulfovibrio sp.]